MATPGAKSDLTDANTKIIVRAIGAGMPVKYAMSKAALSEAVYYKWIREAKKPGADPKFIKFMQEVEKAKTKAVEKLLRQVDKHSKTQYKATIWKLSILDRDTFGTDREEMKTLKTLVEKLLKGEAAK